MIDLDALRKLNLPPDKYAVFGSGPMAVRGIRQSGDVDIIVKPELWEELKAKYPLKEGKEDCIEIGDIEIFNNWKPWVDEIDTLIDTADIIQEIRFVKLEHVLDWKKKMGREKDMKDIKLIEKYKNKVIN